MIGIGEAISSIAAKLSSDNLKAKCARKDLTLENATPREDFVVPLKGKRVLTADPEGMNHE